MTTPQQIQQVVCETEPPLPSSAVPQGQTSSSSQKRISKQLRGDLDRVLLKALAKEPEHRYLSVEAFLEDLHRYRAGLPVRAHRASWAYRARKFIRRHRVGVSGVAAALLSLILGLVGTAWQARTAAQERDRARLESEKLQATQEFLVGLFEAASPAQALGREITAKELVARGVEGLDGRLVEQPGVRLEMLKALSRVSAALGDLEQTDRLQLEALDLARELHGENHSEIASLLIHRGHLYNERGAWQEAASILREALTLQRRNATRDPRLELKALGQLAFAHKSQGDFERAVTVLKEALDSARQDFGGDSLEVADLLNDLGNALGRQSEYAAAEKALREALGIWQKLLPSEHPDIATVTGNLGVLLFRKGDLREAEPYYRQAIEMRQRLLGDGHPNLAASLHNLANFLSALGRDNEAAGLHRQVLNSVLESMGEGSPYYATTLDSLAKDLARSHQFEEAMALFPRAEQLLRESVGREHEFYALHLSNRADALHLQGLDSSALPWIEESIDISRGLQRVQALAAKLVKRGSIRFSLGQAEAAVVDFREALEIQREALPERHPNLVPSSSGLGWALLALGKASEAVPLLREALVLAEDSLPSDHWHGVEARAALGAALVEMGALSEGEPLLRRGHQQLEASRGPLHPATRRAAAHLR